MDITTYGISIDEYGRPKTYKDRDAIRVLLVQLILLNPGTIQSHPHMGVGLIKNWRYSYIERMSSLELEISKQIDTYLPMFAGATVTIQQNPNNSKEIFIFIEIADEVYGFQTEELTLKDL